MRTLYLPIGIDFRSQRERDLEPRNKFKSRLNMREMGMKPPEMGFKVRTLPEVKV